MLKTNTNITETRSTINVQTTETTLLEVDVAKYQTLEVQLVNNGGSELNSIKLYSRIHNEAPWVELELNDFNETNTLLLDFYTSDIFKPNELPPDEHCNIILNCTGKKEDRLTGMANTICYPVYVYYYVE